jgi:hypothetical protein
MQHIDEYTPTRTARIPDGLEAAARAGSPELAGLGFSELLRAALAVLAGHPKEEAAKLARGQRGRVLTVPESPEVRAAREGQPA